MLKGPWFFLSFRREEPDCLICRYLWQSNGSFKHVKKQHQHTAFPMPYTPQISTIARDLARMSAMVLVIYISFGQATTGKIQVSLCGPCFLFHSCHDFVHHMPGVLSFSAV